MSKRYCLKCDRPLRDDETGLYCRDDSIGENIDLTGGDVFEVRRICYKRLKTCKENINNGIADLIIGFIFFAIAAIFFGLSFKLDVIGERVFNPTSMEFIVSMICLAFSVLFFVLSAIKLIPYRSRKKYYTSLLARISSDENKK